MKKKLRYHRVLVKLSGESLCSPGGHGIEAAPVAQMVKDFLAVAETGVQLAVVVGGGNIIRGQQLAEKLPIDRATADGMGMLGTVINALALADAMAGGGLSVRTMSAIAMGDVCEPFARRRAARHLEKGRVVILAGGTGNPFFTTDTCAALRACQIGADALFKATKVNGVFDADPVTNKNAKRYSRLSYQKVLDDKLGVMDLTAVLMCMQNQIPIVVFKMSEPGNFAAVIRGDDIGTTITR
ncbi:MAG: UMP kinase [Planctomycetota bacterium]|nr:UMP kinase [Planctomycetota bacterium]